ncbi:hypothetical protein [Bacteroides xylanisolvens]|uniref:hypothetical protein n=1 Tax=Bacteroides xylanisolvens TaxID=371601 RepID=UPI001C8B3B40|nr:hypothetical protein [Bacteroides xylanisolvens]
MIIVLVYRCKGRAFNGWLLSADLVDIVIYVCWQRKSVTIAQMSQLSSVRYFPAGRSAPFREADGEADRRKSPAVTGMIRKV